MLKNEILGRLVWHTTKESREAGHFTILAIIETIVSVAFCLWLAQQYDLYFLFLTSITLAFFVLLRSDESVEIGREIFLGYIDKKERPSKTVIAATLFFGGTLSILVSWLLSATWLIEISEWGLIWRAIIIGYLSLNFSLATMFAISGPGIMTDRVTTSVVVGGGIAGVGTIIGAGIAAGAGAVTGVGAVTTIAVVLAIAVSAAGGGGAVLVALIFLFNWGIIAGVLFRTIGIKFFAILLHLRQGIPLFSKNWVALTFKTDALTPPELIPGLPENHDFHFKSILSELKKDDIDERVIGILSIFFLIIPSLFYRYYLKTTAWFYLPLIWLSHIPSKLKDEKTEKIIFKESLGYSLLEIILFFISCGSLIFFLWSVFDLQAFFDALDFAATNNLPKNPVLILAAIDYTKLNAWYWIPAFASAFGVTVFFIANILRAHAKGHPDYQPEQWQLWSLLKLNGIKNFLSLVWVAIGVYTLTLYLYINCQLPEVINPWLSMLFGQPTCLLIQQIPH
ncbi:MAG: hypothetical protein OQJ97_11980 [Rhodospirillales bacterium]|nr:hypothetical protein [Rhodospirillales bacterium]